MLRLDESASDDGSPSQLSDQLRGENITIYIGKVLSNNDEP